MAASRSSTFSASCTRAMSAPPRRGRWGSGMEIQGDGTRVRRLAVEGPGRRGIHAGEAAVFYREEQEAVAGLAGPDVGGAEDPVGGEAVLGPGGRQERGPGQPVRAGLAHHGV